jgi:hypothetical protein
LNRERTAVVEAFGLDPTHGRRMLLIELNELADWPNEISEAKPHFVLFLAMDAEKVTTKEIAEFAERTISQGTVYLCAWGPDCERVHDIFDDVLLLREIDGDDSFSRERIIMTTWHHDEPLDEALYFALFNSIPAENYIEACQSVLSISVGRREWANEIRRLLREPSRLIAEVESRDDTV